MYSLLHSLLFLLLLCHRSHLIDTTIILTITACTTQQFAILLTTATVFVHTQLHTRLIEFLLTVVRFFWPFYKRTSSICRTFPKQKVHDLAFSKTLSRKLVYMHSHTYLSLMLIVVSLFGRHSMDLLVCICLLCKHELLLRLLSLYLSFLSFIVMIFVFVDFAYSFHMIDIRLFRFFVTICYRCSVIIKGSCCSITWVLSGIVQ